MIRGVKVSNESLIFDMSRNSIVSTYTMSFSCAAVNLLPSVFILLCTYNIHMCECACVLACMLACMRACVHACVS